MADETSDLIYQPVSYLTPKIERKKKTSNHPAITRSHSSTLGENATAAQKRLAYRKTRSASTNNVTFFSSSVESKSKETTFGLSTLMFSKKKNSLHVRDEKKSTTPDEEYSNTPKVSTRKDSRENRRIWTFSNVREKSATKKQGRDRSLSLPIIENKVQEIRQGAGTSKRLIRIESLV